MFAHLPKKNSPGSKWVVVVGDGGRLQGWQVMVGGVEKRKGKLVYKNKFRAILSKFGTMFKRSTVL